MTFSTKPRKRFGQHWLCSEAILSKIIAAAELEDHDRVLEIGPGTGVLTQRLLEKVAQVVAIEIDRDLCRKLEKQFAAANNFVLWQGDILQVDLEQPFSNYTGLSLPNKVVANIPYYITGPILEKLLGTLSNPQRPPFDSIVLLVQQEIAERLSATSGTKAFGGLSVKVQYLAECDVICLVPPKAFQPPPKVTSAVIRLRPRQLLPKAENPKLLLQLVNLGFASKRKMLRNNLVSLIERSRLLSLLAELDISENVRAEDLSVAHWVALSNKILKEPSFLPDG